LNKYGAHKMVSFKFMKFYLKYQRIRKLYEHKKIIIFHKMSMEFGIILYATSFMSQNLQHSNLYIFYYGEKATLTIQRCLSIMYVSFAIKLYRPGGKRLLVYIL